MKEPRNYREAHHVLAWGGCMRPSPYRLHSQGYTPPPAPKPGLIEKASAEMLTILRLFKFYRSSGMPFVRALKKAVDVKRRDRALARGVR